MNGALLMHIMRYSLSRPGLLQRYWTLAKGIAFLPFLSRQFRSQGSDAIRMGAQSGDDIYPLF